MCARTFIAVYVYVCVPAAPSRRGQEREGHVFILRAQCASKHIAYDVNVNPCFVMSHMISVLPYTSCAVWKHK